MGRDFRAIFDAHFAYVWAVLMRLGVPRADGEDLAQEVFVAVHRRLDSYDAGRPIRPWLAGIAANVARQHHRWRRRHSESFDEEALDAIVDPRRLEERSVAQETLLRVLDGLSEAQRGVWVLHVVEELEMKEIAAALDISEDAGYARLKAARERLRAAWRSMEEEVAS